MRISTGFAALAALLMLAACGDKPAAPLPPTGPTAHAAPPPPAAPAAVVGIGTRFQALRDAAGFVTPPADADQVRIETLALPNASRTATLAWRDKERWRIETVTEVLSPTGKSVTPLTKVSGRLRPADAKALEALLADNALFAEPSAANEMGCVDGLRSRIEVRAGGRSWNGDRHCDQDGSSVRLLNLVLGAADTAG